MALIIKFFINYKQYYSLNGTRRRPHYRGKQHQQLSQITDQELNSGPERH